MMSSFTPQQQFQTSILSEASGIAKESINPVDIRPSVVMGFIVFLFVMYLTSIIESYIITQENEYKYDSRGCRLDFSGNRIKTPIIKNGVIIGHNECVRKTTSFTIYMIGFLFSIIIGVIAGSSIYKLHFMWANPKLSAGLYATDRLLGRRG